jgi:hypothetical protein
MFVKLYLSLINIRKEAVSIVPLPLADTFFMETILICLLSSDIGRRGSLIDYWWESQREGDH